MRWWFLVCIFCAPPALAQWVQFTPCGLKDPLMKPEYVFEVPAGPAENIGPYWVWSPAVIAVMNIKPVHGAKVNCSMVYTAARAVLVVGASDEVLRKLGKK